MGSGPRKKIPLLAMLKMKRFVVRYPMTSARKLKRKIPELANVAIRTVQVRLFTFFSFFSFWILNFFFAAHFEERPQPPQPAPG